MKEKLPAFILDRYLVGVLGHLYSHIRTLGHGGNQQNLNGEIIKQIALKLPPLEEQRKIADILSVWDEAIEQQTRLIELKRERKRGLMQQLLTGKVRFKEFEGLEWDNTTLSLHASKRKGKNVELNNERKGLPYIGSVAFSGWYSQYTCDANASLRGQKLIAFVQHALSKLNLSAERCSPQCIASLFYSLKGRSVSSTGKNKSG